MEKKKSIIKVAGFSFKCPICGKKIVKGSNYVEEQGFKFCVECGLNN